MKSEHKAALKEKGKKSTPLDSIFDNMLTDEDWEILSHYVTLLEPCHDATMDLQGQAGDGKPCALFNVLTDIECILEELTTAYDKYKDAPIEAIEGQWHFATQIRLALDKAQDYYGKLDDSPAYLASLVLHPSFTWKFIESQWSGKRLWISQGKRALQALWQAQYKQQEISDSSPMKQRSRVLPQQLNSMEEYRLRSLAKARSASMKVVKGDELERWFEQQLTTDDIVNPLEWWRNTGCKYYPHLAQMAVDLLSIPAMSDEPERLFSRLGLIITPRRNGIQHDAVQALCCLHSWDKSGLIDLRAEPACT